VPQDDIAEALGVSRIPLREALIALEREGWVTIEIHRGAFVNALDADMVEDHFELFGIIYGFAIHPALERSGDRFIEQMAALQSDLAATTDPAEAGKLIFNVYRCIVDAARSPRVGVVLRAISSLVPGDFFETVPATIDTERKSINALVRALRRHDGDKVADEFRRMMRRVSKEVAQLFRERGLFDMAEQSGQLGA
jgi:DNA-binding GntR family transcriptional regulator